MAKVTVKHSRISRGSSIGMLLLGVITLLFVSGLLGLILIAVGGVMYWFYRRQNRVSQASGAPQVAKGASP